MKYGVKSVGRWIRSISAKAFMFYGIFLFLFINNISLATTFANRPLGEVLKEAVYVVRGVAGTVRTEWGKGDEHGSIFTYTELEISEVLKSPAPQPNAEVKKIEKGDRIFIRQPGGEKDGIEMGVPGAAAFSDKEDVVLTLGAYLEPDNSYPVNNLTAGKYKIAEENGETYLVNSLSANEVFNPMGEVKGAAEGSYISKINLGVFKQIIKSIGNEKPKKQTSSEASDRANAPQFEAPPEVKKENNPQQGRDPKSDSAEAEGKEASESKSPWILISFAFFLVGGGALLYFLLQNKNGDSS